MNGVRGGTERAGSGTGSNSPQEGRRLEPGRLDAGLPSAGLPTGGGGLPATTAVFTDPFCCWMVTWSRTNRPATLSQSVS